MNEEDKEMWVCKEDASEDLFLALKAEDISEINKIMREIAEQIRSEFERKTLFFGSLTLDEELEHNNNAMDFGEIIEVPMSDLIEGKYSIFDVIDKLVVLLIEKLHKDEIYIVGPVELYDSPRIITDGCVGFYTLVTVHNNE